MSVYWKKNGFAEDHFVTVDDAADLPVGKPVIVTLKRWREQQVALLARGTPLGIIAEPTAVLDPATDPIYQLAVVVIPFVKFTDGRGYSLARRLRDEFGFLGEVRATGDVLLDQMPLMIRCGFDGFIISHEPTALALQNGHWPVVPEVYQRAVFGRARTTATFVSRGT